MAKRRKRSLRQSPKSREEKELNRLFKEASRGGDMPNMLNLPALMEMLELAGIEGDEMSKEDMDRFLGMMSTPMLGGRNVNASEDSDRRMRAMLPDDKISDDQMNRQLYENAKRGVANGSEEFIRPVDDYGVMANFITFFITDDMKNSFHAIAERFLRNEPMITDPLLAQKAQEQLDASEKENTWYFRDGVFRNYLTPSDKKMDAQDSYNHKILNLMLDCMRLGSEYSRNFLLALYKTYYKKEYNRLKRYSTVNEYDLLTLFDESERDLHGKDTTLHATSTSHTVMDRMQQELASSPGNMNCFPRANTEDHYEYYRTAIKGGYIRTGRNELGVEEIVEVNRLFGSIVEEEPIGSQEQLQTGQNIQEAELADDINAGQTGSSEDGNKEAAHIASGEDAAGNNGRNFGHQDVPDTAASESAKQLGHFRLNAHGLQENSYEINQEDFIKYTQRLDEPSIFPAVSRITVMCEIMGIRIDDTCNMHLNQMNMERWSQSEGFYTHVIGKEGQKPLSQVIDELSENSVSWIKAAYPEVADPAKYQKDVSYLPLQLAQDMIQQVLSSRDIFKTVVYGTREFDLAKELSHAMFMMGMHYPGYLPGFSTVIYLAVVDYLSNIIVDLYQMRERELVQYAHIEPEHYVEHAANDTIMGQEEKRAYDDAADRALKTLFTTSSAQAGNKDQGKPAAKNIKNESLNQSPDQGARPLGGTSYIPGGEDSSASNTGMSSDEKDAEIARLRQLVAEQQRQLKEKEEAIFLKDQSVIRQRTLYEEARDKAAKLEESRVEYEANRRELIALRDHIFKMTEDDIEEEEDQILLERMKRAIADKKIMIIGGHENWQKRMRKIFPKWKYVSVSENLGLDTVEGMDHIYFFTDFMSHELYYKFVSLMRRRDMNWYYIHGTNIEKNIRQIYGDVVRMG